MRWLDKIQLVIFVATLGAIGYICFNVDVVQEDLVFELLIALLIILIFIMYKIYSHNHGKLISNFVISFIKKIMPAESFTPRNKVAKILTDNFPYGVFTILSFIFFVIVILDLFVVKKNINDIIYGLVLDGIGAVLLGSDVFLRTKQLRAGNVTEFEIEDYQDSTATYHFWGLIFLIIGFVLQILAILINSL